jgi:hypothetical protein
MLMQYMETYFHTDEVHGHLLLTDEVRSQPLILDVVNGQLLPLKCTGTYSCCSALIPAVVHRHVSLL